MALPLSPRKAIRRARSLRRVMTPAEARLWSALRRDALGVRFRRQHPIGPYVADFACYTHTLIVEVDGSMHDGEEAVQRDAKRDAALEGDGWLVMRFKNREIFEELDGVLEQIREALRGRLRD